MKTNNNGTILCIISLICMFVLPIIFFFVSGGNGDISGATAAAFSVMTRLDLLAYVAAWVLAIVSRVKYKNTFSLVLIIIYGAMLGAALIGFVVLILIMLGVY